MVFSGFSDGCPTGSAPCTERVVAPSAAALAVITALEKNLRRDIITFKFRCLPLIENRQLDCECRTDPCLRICFPFAIDPKIQRAHESKGFGQSEILNLACDLEIVCL